MKNITYLTIIMLALTSCTTEIKNEDAKINVEEGTTIEASNQLAESKIELTEDVDEADKNHILGYWVGYFENADVDAYIDEINIKDSLVVGHSVVAGNDRPFKGKVYKNYIGTYFFKVSEPGDDKYDGEFDFKIINNQLIGEWKAYGDINIQERKYTLEKKTFEYNPDVMLERSSRYVNWTKYTEKLIRDEYDEGEFEEWIAKEFATATELIYEKNASNTILSKTDVENLKKGDLTIIRNAIYARHGYSFKHRPLRVFFDAQSWYIPVHTNIKNDFTEIEKQNIELLLRYEKNATEYYDRFGRG